MSKPKKKGSLKTGGSAPEPVNDELLDETDEVPSAETDPTSDPEPAEEPEPEPEPAPAVMEAPPAPPPVIKSAAISATSAKAVVQTKTVIVEARRDLRRIRIGKKWYSFQQGKRCKVPADIVPHLRTKGIV